MKAAGRRTASEATRESWGNPVSEDRLDHYVHVLVRRTRLVLR